MRRVLVGTVGYHLLRDYSIGPKLLPKLRGLNWPPGTDVDELNWGPVAIVFNFQEMAIPYNRVVILTATDLGNPVGSISLRRWCGSLPPPEQIQDRVAEAVTGTISLDNLLIIGEHFDIWPDEVFIVDVQPGPEEAGDTFTKEVEAQIPTVIAITRRMATDDSAALPRMIPVYGNELTYARA